MKAATTFVPTAHSARKILLQLSLLPVLRDAALTIVCFSKRLARLIGRRITQRTEKRTRGQPKASSSNDREETQHRHDHERRRRNLEHQRVSSRHDGWAHAQSRP